eukprot:8987160-Karenia_brevis.AAC.1
MEPRATFAAAKKRPKRSTIDNLSQEDDGDQRNPEILEVLEKRRRRRLEHDQLQREPSAIPHGSVARVLPGMLRGRLNRDQLQHKPSDGIVMYLIADKAIDLEAAGSGGPEMLRGRLKRDQRKLRFRKEVKRIKRTRPSNRIKRSRSKRIKRS